MCAIRLPAPLLAVVAIISVQFGNAVAGSFFDQTGPMGAAALRLAWGALIIVAIVRPRVRRWPRSTWLGVAVLGVALAGMNSLIYLSIDRIPIGIAVTVELFGPLAIALVSVRRLADLLWALLAVAGVLLLGLQAGGELSWSGLLLAAGAALFWALYILASSRLGGRVRGVDGLAVAMLLAAAIVVPFGATEAAHAVSIAPWLLAAFALVAVLTSALPYALEFLALKRMPARVFGILSSLGPAMAALAGLLVLHQLLGWFQLIAIALVTTASVGVVLSTRSVPPPALQ